MRSISKPALVACIAALAAMIVPAVSSASEITFANGQRVPVGTVLTADGTNFELNTSTLGPEICGTFNFNEEVVKNDGLQFELATSGPSANLVTAGCRRGAYDVSYENLAWQVYARDTSSNIIKRGTMSTTFTQHVGPQLVCWWTGKNVELSYQVGGSVYKFNNNYGMSSQGCGTARVSGSFRVHLAGSKTAVIFR